jgi:hypothetical protein
MPAGCVRHALFFGNLCSGVRAENSITRSHHIRNDSANNGKRGLIVQNLVLHSGHTFAEQILIPLVLASVFKIPSVFILECCRCVLMTFWNSASGRPLYGDCFFQLDGNAPELLMIFVQPLLPVVAMCFGMTFFLLIGSLLHSSVWSGSWFFHPLTLG